MQPSLSPRDLAADHLSRARALASSPALDAHRLATILRDVMTFHELPLVAVRIAMPVDAIEALELVSIEASAAHRHLGVPESPVGVWGAAWGEIQRLDRHLRARRESGVHRSTVLRLVPRGESQP